MGESVNHKESGSFCVNALTTRSAHKEYIMSCVHVRERGGGYGGGGGEEG